MSAALGAVHPLRQRLADELHARPTQPVAAPARVLHVARLSGVDPAADAGYLTGLCERLGLEPPRAGQRQFRFTVDGVTVKWERYTECCGWTVVMPGLEGEGVPDTVRSLIAAAPGQNIAVVEIDVHPGTTAAEAAALGYFDPGTLVASNLGNGRAEIWSDFRLGPDGEVRLVLGVRDDLTPRTIGNVVQRFLDIETYRMLALLALPLAQRGGQRATALDRRLAELSAAFVPGRGEGADDAALLADLGAIAAEVENLVAESAWRFSAAAAYHALVEDRLAENRETPIGGFETVGYFMNRRLTPAMRTCQSAAARQDSLSERVARSSQILRARVEIALQAQNQSLLRSMEQRAGLQLRLQETVEGLSVVVISYYLIGLVSYFFKGLEEIVPGLPHGTIVVTLVLPLVLGAVYLGMRRMKRRLHRPH
ncbi:DUF3422 family protein [Zavarzinia compransoris]|uniref:DUF3422 domain-containing protein n=1 Tax=Zavarzinia compransoris TaxID=1264899 RepID=A0A317E0Z0_9PROT|nr:DUF3422 domain-containing protein [Zavarzinia compransoris]PWR19033.1 DUF3422 domain-containing protein [Zavarzinia compransoris]TDP49040.1 putative membrane-anchored protein [Zavarzinia compransoris]